RVGDHRVVAGREGPVLRAERGQGLPAPDVLLDPGRRAAPMSFDNAYESITEENDDQHWAFGTGFDDPLAGVDRALPSHVDSADLVAYCLMLGDDALILSQRLTEWCSRAPELEEDVALANIALDLLGQARLLLSRAGEVEGAGRDEDALAYLREEPEFRHV